MKTKNLFVISPHHYCHSTATIIEGLNKLDGIKVFSNATHNYCKHPIQTFKTQLQVAKMADYVMICHSALGQKYKETIGAADDELGFTTFTDDEVGHTELAFHGMSDVHELAKGDPLLEKMFEGSYVYHGGNPDEGAKVMDKTVEQIRKKAYGTTEQPNEIDGLRSLVPLTRSVA